MVPALWQFFLRKTMRIWRGGYSAVFCWRATTKPRLQFHTLCCHCCDCSGPFILGLYMLRKQTGVWHCRVWSSSKGNETYKPSYCVDKQRQRTQQGFGHNPCLEWFCVRGRRKLRGVVHAYTFSSYTPNTTYTVHDVEIWFTIALSRYLRLSSSRSIGVL